MAYSLETKILVNILGYGLFVLGLLFLWRRTNRTEEPLLLLKLFGYTFLSMFRFTINHISLPLGALIAILLSSRTSINKKIKQRAALLGFGLFLAGFIPIADYLEQIFYPRDQLATYYMENLEHKGFNLVLVNQRGKCVAMLTEKDEIGQKLYRSMGDASPVDRISGAQDIKYQLIVEQDHDDERFERLRFTTGETAEFLRLHMENMVYTFRTTDEFQQLFRKAVSEQE